MRRVWKIALCVAGAVVIVPAVVLAPPTTELSINLTCGMKPLTPTCTRRMQAMGHVWVKFGFLDRAIAWYGRAAAGGNDKASYFHLGWAYEQRGYRDLVSRSQNFEKARDEAVEKILADLKPRYDAGLISESDYIRAMEKPFEQEPNLREDFQRAENAYRIAAEGGFAPAVNNLGQMYVSGVFGRQRMAEGARLVIQAAEAGNPVGAVNATLVYTAGMGVARDADKAHQWGQWDGEKTNPRDLSAPILEYTRVALSGDSEPRMVALIREVARRRIPLDASFKPLQPDARLSTFKSVTDKLNKRSD